MNIHVSFKIGIRYYRISLINTRKNDIELDSVQHVDLSNTLLFIKLRLGTMHFLYRQNVQLVRFKMVISQFRSP